LGMPVPRPYLEVGVTAEEMEDAFIFVLIADNLVHITLAGDFSQAQLVAVAILLSGPTRPSRVTALRGSELDSPIGKADPGTAEAQPNLGCLLLVEGATVALEPLDG
jgi:hypothetical protein